MTRFLQFTFSGLTDAAVFSLLSIGWVAVYRVSSVPNLTQGSLLVVAALFGQSLVSSHIPVGLALFLAVIAAGILGGLIDVVALRPARPGVHAAPVIITLGLAGVLDECSRLIWGSDARILDPFMNGPALVVHGARLQLQTLLLWVVTLLLLFLLFILFERTTLGKALSATAQSPEGAGLVGINAKLMRTAAFALGGTLAGIAGVLLIPISAVSWNSGIILGIDGFIAAVLGRWTYRGALLGSLLIGLLENYAAGYISAAWKEFVGLAIVLVALIAGSAAMQIPEWLQTLPRLGTLKQLRELRTNPGD